MGNGFPVEAWRCKKIPYVLGGIGSAALKVSRPPATMVVCTNQGDGAMGALPATPSTSPTSIRAWETLFTVRWVVV